MKDVPVPFHLSKNDRDRRDLPIPFIVYRDKDGAPHFTVDDVDAIAIVLAQRLCGLCGKPLKLGQMWLTGGPASCFQEDGMFSTPHAHLECARYAVQVCPYLAAAVYSRLIEDRTLKPQALHDSARVHNDQVTPPRPPFFVLARTSGVTLVDPEDGSGKKYLLPRRPWKDVEFWLNGNRIGLDEAHRIAEAAGLSPGQMKWWPDGGSPR